LPDALSSFALTLYSGAEIGQADAGAMILARNLIA